jgi:hypothetical protein
MGSSVEPDARQVRARQRLRAFAHEGLIELLEHVRFAHGRADHDGDARAVLPGVFREARVSEGHARRRERHGRAAAHAPGLRAGQVVGRAEILHLARDASAEVRRLEARDRGRPRVATLERRVEALLAGADGAQDAHAGHQHARAGGFGGRTHGRAVQAHGGARGNRREFAPLAPRRAAGASGVASGHPHE